MSTINATGTIYIRNNSGTVEYNINNSIWTTISWPVTINNIDTSNVLKVLFTTDITLNVVDQYFICGSDNIQFGSTSLNPDGSRPTITIIGVTNYPGLIKNGTISDNGKNNIYVYNLKVTTANGSTLSGGGGWIGHLYFGKGVSDNYIVNCSSTGGMITNSGGILGSLAGQGSISLYIYGCSSTGIILNNSGGICGRFCGNTGNVIIQNCWSTGIINTDAGGICGNSCGDTGNVIIQNCYTEGNINQNSGGIFGPDAGYEGNVNVINCYSRGNIGSNAGGIYGNNVSINNIASAINCYSYGEITTPGNGIYGSNNINGTQINCYAADNAWTDISANSNLTGTPNPVVGTTWVSRGANQPYELNNMGYTPYSLIIIDDSSNLIQTYSQTITAGSLTVQAIVSGANYEILAIKQDGSFISVPSITINSNTGVITAGTDVEPGTYTLYIRNTGSYNITQFELTVNEAPTPTVEQSIQEDCICSQKPCAQLSYVGVTQSDKITNITDNRTIATSYIRNNIQDNVRGRQFPSFLDYLRFQQAQLRYY